MRTNQHLLEVLVENPTQGLELINHSLEVMQHEDGVPEYDDILSVDNGMELEKLASGRVGGDGGGRGFEDSGDDISAYNDSVSFEGSLDSTLNTYSVAPGGLDAYSLASNEGSVDDSASKAKVSVTWRGKVYKSRVAAEGSVGGASSKRRSKLSSFGSSMLSEMPSVDQSLGGSVGGGGKSVGLGYSLASSSVRSLTSVDTVGSTTEKKKRVKPRDFPKKLRRRGPFSMVGPRDVPVSFGLPPIQTRTQVRATGARSPSTKRRSDVDIAPSQLAAKRRRLRRAQGAKRRSAVDIAPSQLVASILFTVNSTATRFARC